MSNHHLSEPPIIFSTKRSCAYVTLNQPGIHNAFNDGMIKELITLFSRLNTDPEIRCVILSGKGKSFSAGADLKAMQTAGQMTKEDNIAGAKALSEMLSVLSRCSKPVIAVVQGAVMGGGIGLVAGADIALADQNSRFSFSEVKLGLIPAAISPYVIKAIGLRWSRRLFVTGENFDSHRAKEIGLIHDIYDDKVEAFQEAEKLAAHICKNGPLAVAEAKKLAFYVGSGLIDEDMQQETARRIANQRASDEGLEGMSAFLEKRSPTWIKRDDHDAQ